MAGQVGLRERKKQRTLQAIVEAAMRLMIERGFDAVSVADIAAAAEVSKMTVFNYFATKEDILLAVIEDHADEAARVVRSREPQESPLAALRRHFLERIEAGDPATGTSGEEKVLAFIRLVVATPSLMLRFLDQQLRAETTLTAALAEVPEISELAATLAAAQIASVQRALTMRNLGRVIDGVSVDRLRRDAAAEASQAFDQLRQGLATTPLA